MGCGCFSEDNATTLSLSKTSRLLTFSSILLETNRMYSLNSPANYTIPEVQKQIETGKKVNYFRINQQPESTIQGYTLNHDVSGIKYSLKGKNEEYHIDERIGEGSYGMVFKGYTIDKDLNKVQCAIKLMKYSSFEEYQKGQQSFLHEQKIYKQLQKQNQSDDEIRYIQSIQNNDKRERAFILKLYSNNMLKMLIKKKISDNVIMNLLASVIEELKLMKKNKFIHLDIKSDNILVKVTKYNQYKAILTDFGLTQQVNSSTKLKIYKSKIGTLYHKAPQLLGLQYPNFDETEETMYKADIFSLGVTLFQWLCCSQKFTHYGSDSKDNPSGYYYEWWSIFRRKEQFMKPIKQLIYDRHPMWQLILCIMLQPNPMYRCSLQQLNQLIDIILQILGKQLTQKLQSASNNKQLKNESFCFLTKILFSQNLKAIMVNSKTNYAKSKYCKMALQFHKKSYLNLINVNDQKLSFSNLPQNCRIKINQNLQQPLMCDVIIAGLKECSSSPQKLKLAIASIVRHYQFLAYLNYIKIVYKNQLQFGDPQINYSQNLNKINQGSNSTFDKETTIDKLMNIFQINKKIAEYVLISLKFPLSLGNQQNIQDVILFK